MTTIGIIGSGHVGSNLAKAAVAHGYDVVLSNSQGPDSLATRHGLIGGYPVVPVCDSPASSAITAVSASAAAGSTACSRGMVTSCPSELYRLITRGSI
jgi:8-hydroxy-5-deazaflavin:NADPH oxidoreductase